MPRVYERKFDWGEAKRLRAEGLSYEAIGKHLGASRTMIYFVCNPDAYRRMKTKTKHYQRSGRCEKCSAPTSPYRYHHKTEKLLCGRCAKLEYLATNVRDGEQRCVTCREWKPFADFPRNRTRLTGRHSSCRPCLTIARREYRHRNPETEAAATKRYREQRDWKPAYLRLDQCGPDHRCVGCDAQYFDGNGKHRKNCPVAPVRLKEHLKAVAA
jgi:hypothetical protein